MSEIPLPATGEYIKAVRESSRAARTRANISITPDAIRRFLLAPAFTSTFDRLRHAHGMTMPLNFPSVVTELNVLSLLSILNFASGYRVPLHKATGRGAFDNIRAFIFAAYISSSTGSDYFSARGMQEITEATVADLMGVTDSLHIERPHESISGLTVGELGGPVYEVVQLIAKTLRETGEALVRGGYPDLGSFVLEALKEGEKAKKAGGDEAEVAVERLIRGIPAFQDMALVYGQPVYCFKKALLTLHAVALRFGKSEGSSSVPVPRTEHLPIFSDNVIPSLLVHLGVIDLTNADPALGLPQLFPDAQDPARLQTLLAAVEPVYPPAKKTKEVPKEGPLLTVEQAYVLRAAAIDACELIVEAAKELDVSGEAEDLGWLKGITLPELDAWIWAVAKDRPDYRKLERFALRNTAYF